MDLKFCWLCIHQILLVRVSVSDRYVLTSLGTALGKMRELLKIIKKIDKENQNRHVLLPLHSKQMIPAVLFQLTRCVQKKKLYQTFKLSALTFILSKKSLF